MSNTDYSAAAFWRALPLFAGLPTADFEAIIASSACKTYSKGQPVILQGDPAERFFTVLDGWVEIYRNTPEGEEFTITLLARGDMFGEAAIVENAEYDFFARAAEFSEIVEIPAKVLRARAGANPDISQRIMTSLAHKVHMLEAEYEHAQLMSASQRVGCLLLQMSKGKNEQGDTLSLPFEKTLAARTLSMKPETFSRALHQLQPIGVTVHGSDIKIEDYSRLSSFACSHCTVLDKDCLGARLFLRKQKGNSEE